MKRLGAMVLNALTSRTYELGLCVLFWGLVSIFPLDTLIILLNGVWVGTMITITVAYGELIFGVFGNKSKFADVKQMVTGLLGSQFAYACTVSSSVYVHATSDNGTTLFIIALGRFVAIFSAIAQITAPNIGKPLFSGRDNIILWVSAAMGLTTAVVVTLLQATQAFAWPL